MNLHNSHVPARCETVYEALEKWVNKPLNKLPHDLKTVATAYIPKWTTLTAKERIAKAIEVDRQRDTKLRIKLARAARQKQQDKYDPAMLLQGDVGWYDATLEADHWAALSDIGPQDAALLLCQFNPNEQDYETAKRITTDELGPEHLTRLVQRLTDIDKSDHRPRTLRDWYLTARDAGLRFHSWASRYMEATPAPVVSDTPATPAPVEVASDGPAPKQNKSEKTLIFEAKVQELLSRFWSERTPGTEPTKNELCKLVYQEILRTNVRGARKTTLSMVIDVAKTWKLPLVLPTYVRDSQFNEKRHPFKGEK